MATPERKEDTPRTHALRRVLVRMHRVPLIIGHKQQKDGVRVRGIFAGAPIAKGTVISVERCMWHGPPRPATGWSLVSGMVQLSTAVAACDGLALEVAAVLDDRFVPDQCRGLTPTSPLVVAMAKDFPPQMVRMGLMLAHMVTRTPLFVTDRRVSCVDEGIGEASRLSRDGGVDGTSSISFFLGTSMFTHACVDARECGAAVVHFIHGGACHAAVVATRDLKKGGRINVDRGGPHCVLTPAGCRCSACLAGRSPEAAARRRQEMVVAQAENARVSGVATLLDRAAGSKIRESLARVLRKQPRALNLARTLLASKVPLRMMALFSMVGTGSVVPYGDCEPRLVPGPCQFK